MTNTKTEELAALYVLDLLRGQELEEFERLLSTDEQAAKLVHELSEGLHGPMRQFNGPERMDLLDGIKDRIGLLPGQANRAEGNNKREVKEPLRRGWMRALSVAATLLLALNIIQFFGPFSSNVQLQEELAQTRKSEQELMVENETIKAFNKSWESEYMNLARRMLPFVGSKDGIGQFTVIDLTAVKGEPDVRRDGDISEYFLSRSPLKFTSMNSQAIPERSEKVAVGYVVWKEDEGRGYIDLYNIAEAAPGRAPFLWLRETEADPYLPIGYLPSLEQGTGTFYFSVDHENFEPGKVIITEESVDGPGKRPSPFLLMEGP